MPRLSDFLSEKAKDLNQVERKRRRDEWVESVTRLMAQFRTWLREADPQNLLTISGHDLDKLEQGLGAYRVPALDIEFEDALVRIVPVGRNVIRFRNMGGTVQTLQAEGRVDITDGARKYTLYRTQTDGADRWVAVGESEVNPQPLDQALFERIMLELLS